MLRVNYQGHDYQIIGPDDDGDGYVDVTSGSIVVLKLRVRFSGGSLPWPSSGWSDPVPFQIFRQPIRSAAQAGPTAGRCRHRPGRFWRRPRAVRSESAAGHHHVHTRRQCRLYPSRRAEWQCAGLGQASSDRPDPLADRQTRERTGGDPGNANWRDLTNLWVSINPRNGRTSTAEMAASHATDPDRCAARITTLRPRNARHGREMICD